MSVQVLLNSDTSDVRSQWASPPCTLRGCRQLRDGLLRRAVTLGPFVRVPQPLMAHLSMRQGNTQEVQEMITEMHGAQLTHCMPVMATELSDSAAVHMYSSQRVPHRRVTVTYACCSGNGGARPWRRG